MFPESLWLASKLQLFSAFNSSKMGSKSLRSVGADLGNRAEAEVEGPAGAEAWPEMAEKLVKWGVPSYEKEDISASDSDSSNMTSSFSMVGGVSKMLRSVEIFKS